MPRAVHYQNPLPPSRSLLTTKRARTRNISEQMFQERVSASVSIFPPLLSHVQQGKQHWIVLFPLHGRGNVLRPAVCGIVLLERRKGVSPRAWGVLKVEHILVCQMNHQQGGAAQCPPALPAHVSSSVSLMVGCQKFLKPLRWLWYIKFV